MVNVTLSVPTELWFEVQPANQAKRFYRVVPGPISIRKADERTFPALQLGRSHHRLRLSALNAGGPQDRAWQSPDGGARWGGWLRIGLFALLHPSAGATGVRLFFRRHETMQLLRQRIRRYSDGMCRGWPGPRPDVPAPNTNRVMRSITCSLEYL